MNQIDVVSAEGKFKILVDQCQRGALLSSPRIANKEAQRVHDRELPHAVLHLVPIQENIQENVLTAVG
jgi:hypothetical protein